MYQLSWQCGSALGLDIGADTHLIGAIRGGGLRARVVSRARWSRT